MPETAPSYTILPDRVVDLSQFLTEFPRRRLGEVFFLRQLPKPFAPHYIIASQCTLTRPERNNP